MRFKALALIAFSLLAIPAFADDSTKYGGCWLTTRAIGFTTEMTAGGKTPAKEGSGGTVLLSYNYYTILDSIPLNDSIYTKGIGVYYEEDSTSSDSSSSLALDAFVGQTIQVDAYFISATATEIFVTVEQALDYYPPATDSALDNGSTVGFQFGFKVTDTLFQDTLNANDLTDPNDTLYCFLNGNSDVGHPSHHYTDSFLLVRPLVRIKVKNYEGAALNRPIHFQLYCRSANEVMSGASGRQFDRQTFPQRRIR